MPRKEITIEMPAMCRIPHRGFLLENGVKVVVIHDPTTTTASAAMNIKVGSNHDPEELPGLAHLCEHMLFLGTEKYPAEGDYDHYISRNGGSNNAWTGGDSTNYYFAVTGDAFLGALDRFVEFFRSPTFTPSGLAREVQAVHSEDEKNHNSDFWRLDEIHRNVMKEDHPRFRYGNGNEQTLWNEPRAKGIDVRAELLKFYEKHYVAEAACLVVYSTMEADAVLDVVEPALKAMRSDPTAVPSNSFLGPDVNPVSPERGLGQWYNVRAAKASAQQINLKFPVPYGFSTTETSPESYVSHYIGHECDSSPLGVLKQLGYAEEMVAGCGSGGIDDDWDWFVVNVQLTTEGMKNLLTVIDVIFHGFELLRRIGAVDDALFDDSVNTHLLNYNVSETGNPTSHSSNMAARGNKHGLEKAYSGDKLIRNPDKAASFEVLRHFTPDNCLFELLWAKFDESLPEGGVIEPDVNQAIFDALPAVARVPLSEKTRHHSAPYVRSPLPAELKERWSTGVSSGKLVDGLALSPVNEFVATDFELRFAPGENKYPTEIENVSPYGRVWCKPDDSRHKLPKSFIRVQLESPAAYKSPLDRFFFRVALRIIKQQQTELSYFGDLAALHNATAPGANGPEVTVTGVSEKMPVFLSRLLEKWFDREALLGSEQLFALNAQRVLRELTGIRASQPHQLAHEMFLCAVHKQRHHFEDVIKSATTEKAGFDYGSYAAFIDRFLTGGMRYDLLAMGHVDASVATGIAADLDKQLKATGLQPTSEDSVEAPKEVFEIAAPSTLKIDQNDNEAGSRPAVWFLQNKSFNPKDPNSAVELCVTLGPKTLRARNMVAVLGRLFSAPFFGTLRTSESLGYIVYAGARVVENGVTLNFIAQSAVAGPAYLLSRIEAFVDAAEVQIIQALTSDELSTVLKAEMALHDDYPKSIAEEGSMLWGRRRHPAGFELSEKLKADLADITVADVQAFFAEKVSRKSKDRRAFASAVYGNDETIALPHVTEPLFKFPPKREAKAEDEEKEEGKETESEDSGEKKIAMPTYREGEEPQPPVIALKLVAQESAAAVIQESSPGLVAKPVIA